MTYPRFLKFFKWWLGRKWIVHSFQAGILYMPYGLVQFHAEVIRDPALGRVQYALVTTWTKYCSLYFQQAGSSALTLPCDM